MTNGVQAQTQKKMAALENWMAPLFAKAPHLPQSARQILAQIAPWAALIFGILGLVSLLSAGAYLSTLLSFFWGGSMMLRLFLFFEVLVSLIASVLEILAFKPLSARKKKGWNFLFYATALVGLAALVDLIFRYGSSFGGIIGALIGFWLLFEVRGLYR